LKDVFGFLFRKKLNKLFINLVDYFILLTIHFFTMMLFVNLSFVINRIDDGLLAKIFLNRFSFKHFFNIFIK